MGVRGLLREKGATYLRRDSPNFGSPQQNRKMDDMKENENRTRSTEMGAAPPITEAMLRLEVTDLLLLSRLRDVGMARISEGLTLEQRTVLKQIEAALEAYRSHFYSPGHCQ
jgi:hypothetical protein